MAVEQEKLQKGGRIDGREESKMIVGEDRDFFVSALVQCLKGLQTCLIDKWREGSCSHCQK